MMRSGSTQRRGRNSAPAHRRQAGRLTSLALALLLGAGGALLLAACGGGGSEAPRTVDLTVSVTIPASGSNGFQRLAVPADIQAVYIQVTDLSGPTVVQDVELTKNGSTGAYEGTLNSVPVGPSVEFLAEGYDTPSATAFRAGTVIYAGTTTQVITGAPDEVVTVNMEAVGGVIGQPLGVTMTGHEDAILPGTTALITFTVTGTADDTVNWSLAATGGGSFSPVDDGGSGLLLDGTGTAQFSSTYTAPGTDGSYSNTVTIQSTANGQETVQEFFITADSAATGGATQVFIGPSVVGFSLQRTWENNLFITATAVDDKSLAELSYTWGYSADPSTPALAYTDAAVNPGELENYGPEDISGTVTLQVSDADGASTLVNFTVPPGLFPDAVGLPGSRKATNISALGDYACAALGAGEVACWGINAGQNLGDTTATARDQPVGVHEGAGRLTNALSVSAGEIHTCAVTTTGASCWGQNDQGQRGEVNLVTSGSAVPVGGLVAVEEIGAGSRFTCARLTGGKVQCWGTNDDGRLGLGQFNPLPPDVNNDTTRRRAPANVVDVDGSGPGKIATDLSVGWTSACALLDNTQVKCWGDNWQGTLGNNDVAVDSATPVTVLTEDPGTPGTYIALDGVTAVTAGYTHACALRADGTVWCWGNNGNGKLGIGTATGVAAVAGQATVIDASTPALTAVAVEAGYSHTCALMGDGTVRCWGQNGNGQLGDGTTTQREAPTAVVSNILPTNPAVAITAGRWFSCAILSGGNMRCWGDNANGRLGSGDLLTVDQLRAVGVDLFPGALP